MDQADELLNEMLQEELQAVRPDPSIIRNIARGIVRIGKPESVERIAQLAFGKDDPALARAAQEALAAASPASLIDVLEEQTFRGSEAAWGRLARQAFDGDRTAFWNRFRLPLLVWREIRYATTTQRLSPQDAATAFWSALIGTVVTFVLVLLLLSEFPDLDAAAALLCVVGGAFAFFFVLLLSWLVHPLSRRITVQSCMLARILTCAGFAVIAGSMLVAGSELLSGSGTGRLYMHAAQVGLFAVLCAATAYGNIVLQTGIENRVNRQLLVFLFVFVASGTALFLSTVLMGSFEGGRRINTWLTFPIPVAQSAAVGALAVHLFRIDLKDGWVQHPRDPSKRPIALALSWSFFLVIGAFFYWVGVQETGKASARVSISPQTDARQSFVLRVGDEVQIESSEARRVEINMHALYDIVSHVRREPGDAEERFDTDEGGMSCCERLTLELAAGEPVTLRVAPYGFDGPRSNLLIADLAALFDLLSGRCVRGGGFTWPVVTQDRWLDCMRSSALGSGFVTLTVDAGYTGDVMFPREEER